MKGQPSRRPLPKALRHYFEGRSLNAEQLRMLKTMADAGSRPLEFFRQYRTAALLLVVAIASAALILFSVNEGRFGSKTDIYQRVADEVAANHLKSRPLDIQTEDFPSLRQFFTELDFVPINSTLLKDVSWKLMGGRYCSVQGREAAQLRMLSPTGSMRTLYEVPYDKELYAELADVEQGGRPTEMYARGMKVNLWREKGLLFVTVSDPAAKQ